LEPRSLGGYVQGLVVAPTASASTTPNNGLIASITKITYQTSLTAPTRARGHVVKTTKAVIILSAAPSKKCQSNIIGNVTSAPVGEGGAQAYL